MSTMEPNPLVQALQRKTNHQADRIDELEETIVGLEATIHEMRSDLAMMRRSVAEAEE